MSSCPHCGMENSNTARFCKRCGNSLELRPSAVKADAENDRPRVPDTRGDQPRPTFREQVNEVNDMPRFTPQFSADPPRRRGAASPGYGPQIQFDSGLVPTLSLHGDEEVVSHVEGRVGWLHALFGHREQMWLTSHRVVYANKQLLSTTVTCIELEKAEAIATRGIFRLGRLITGILLLFGGVSALLDRSALPWELRGISVVPALVLLAIGLYLVLTVRKTLLCVLASGPLSMVGLVPRERPDHFFNTFSLTRRQLIAAQAQGEDTLTAMKG